MARRNFIFIGVVILVASLTIAVAFGSRWSFGKGGKQVESVPQLLNYQGRLTDPSTGAPVADGDYNITFSIYDVPTGGSALWSEIDTVTVSKGFFNILLGNINPVSVTLFDGSESWIGITVAPNPEMAPRQRIATVGYAFKAYHAHNADTADYAKTAISGIADTANYAHRGGSRDLYHQIIDIAPNSTTKFYVYPKYPNSKVSLYLHGEAFNGVLPEHTHSGNNAHTHTFSGTTDDKSVAHTHSIPNHRHTIPSHSHSYSAADTTERWTLGNHHHCGIVRGSECSNGQDVPHGHRLVYDQTKTTGSWSGNTGYWNGTSGSNSITHNHSFSGTTDAAGAGLSTEGVPYTAYPQDVYVYIDGNPISVAGPYSGEFSSGVIDLSAYITDDSEHYIEIKEEGGTGGRIIYDLFVE